MNVRLRITAWLLAAVAMTVVACSTTDPEPDKWPDPDPVTIQPAGFTTMPVPADNRLTRQGINLGRRLFYDPILSADSTQSCATCHEIDRAFADDRRFSIGITLQEGDRNAPTIINAAWLETAFWDGRAASLEDQALGPVANPIEMAESWPNVVNKLQRHATYPDLFGRAFGSDQITRDRVVKAIAQFERTFVSNNSKFDVWLDTRDTQAAGFSAAAERGLQLFNSERADCFHCHQINSLLTDNRFHNIGVDSDFNDPDVDRGRENITGNPGDLGLFKTPTLRNVEFTAPYMHDGRFATLTDVVQHYNSGGFDSATLDPLLRKRGVGLGLTDQEVADIVEFLKTFSDPTFISNPDLKNPFE
jgi:cytochrome c peroxidase